MTTVERVLLARYWNPAKPKVALPYFCCETQHVSGQMLRPEDTIPFSNKVLAIGPFKLLRTPAGRIDERERPHREPPEV